MFPSVTSAGAGGRGGGDDELLPGQLLRAQHQLSRRQGHGQLPLGRQVAYSTNKKLHLKIGKNKSILF